MLIDDVLVFSAEVKGLRHLANLPRPKVTITSEDVPGALCIWEPASANDGHRDDVRLVPDSGVPIEIVLRAVQDSRQRSPGGHLQLRGIASSFDSATVSRLESLGAQNITAGPHMLMGLDLTTFDDTAGLRPELDVTVATNAESLAQLRSVVRQVFMGRSTAVAAQADDDADFFHAPDTMTYLAVSENGQAVSTGSLLIVEEVANIWSVATLPTARGRGAASAIMQASCAEAKRQGAQIAALRTSDELARRDGLYCRVGFSVVGDEHAWNLDDIDTLNI